MRASIPDIRAQLQNIPERREPRTAAHVVTDANQYVVLTLSSRHSARLLGRNGSESWNTRVYIAQSLYADHPLNHPETLRGVAWAREAVERLVPVLSGMVNQEFGSNPAGAERLR